MRLILALAVVLLPPLAALAQETAPTTPPGQPPAAGSGQIETGNDPTKADDAGATGWGGSWSANEGSQADAPETGTTRQTKPLPPVPQAPVPD